MIRFICFLLGRPYESCKSCETLKLQLEYERSEKQQLTQTLLNIIQPKAFEAPAIELSPIPHTSAIFSRRRAALEEQSRQEAKILRERKHVGLPDKEVEKLENELGISEKEN